MNFYKSPKRAFDILFSALAIVGLSPVLILVSLVLLLTGEGRVFYFQVRIGYRNKPFYIWKFVTMLKDSSKMGTGTITLPNDSRVLHVGRILRYTKINELPQLINIFLGDMSFVGPRPMVKKGWMKYPANIRHQIYNAKPGLTGIGSVVFRDEAKIVASFGDNPQKVYSEVIFPHKGALEMWYQANASFLTDLKIIFLTAWVILFPQSKLHHLIFKNLPDRPVAMIDSK
jgi:lipopolysaccharide/colanic/teichoic acid biosynthesis glycosyltransferase